MLDSRRKVMDKVHLLHGDARKLALPDNSVDLVITHPPYFGVDVKRYGGSADEQINSGSDKKMLKLLLQSVLEIQRVLKPSGSFFIANGPNNHIDIRLVLEIVNKSKFRHVEKIIQNSYGEDPTMDYSIVEKIADNALTTWHHFAFPTDLYHNPFVVRKYNNPVWNLPFNNMGDPVDLALSSRFPVIDAMNKEVPKRLVEMFSKKGDVVLDPFGGSAVVAVAAAELGRVGISNDISEDQLVAAKERMKLTFGE
jgi:DNA modification methylase